MKLSVFAKQMGVRYETAWRWYRDGKIQGHRIGAHTIIINEDQFLPPPEKPARVTVYTRVSSAENRANLESQAERVISFCIARGWVVSKVVKECGSGVNDQRPQFLALLADTSITHIVVEHKDRCSRFGVAYIQTLLATQGRELVIVNQADTSQDDLMQDGARDHYLFYGPTLRAKTGGQEERRTHRRIRCGGLFVGA